MLFLATLFFGFLTALFFGLFNTQLAGAVRSPTVDTSSGPVTGFVDSNTPNVAQFLGIPFAEQPVGERRWLPPILKSREATINATAFGNSCPQFLGNKTTVWSADAPELGIIPGIGEDCLSVNVWTPQTHCREGASLPVIAWLYGGGFQTGGGNVPYQNPGRWIERSQKHIVVSINYRVNIFGFPNAAGLREDEQNLGLLDQRAGLEWIRSNIANFGGNPNHITLWGQSAGAIAVDYYNFAYPQDSLVNGFIMESGNALVPIGSDDPGHSNFTHVANEFGCGNLSAQAELDCLRKVSSEDIIAFLKERDNSNTMPALGFYPIIDNRTKFANYTERALAGNFAKKPALMGTTVREGVPYDLPYNRENGPNMTMANYYTLFLFLCPTVKTIQNRYTAGASTHQYLYGGNFSNISPQWWEGAYHASEVPLVFGTSGIARGASTQFELDVSTKMQEYWLAFVEDPVNGLSSTSWDAYKPDGNGVLFGWENVVSQPIAEATLEGSCIGEAPKPGALPPP